MSPGAETAAIRSVLLAAGLGERLKPLTEEIPKPALPVLDVPLGTFSLALLCSACPPVVVNVSQRGEAVRAALEPFLTECDHDFLWEEPGPYGTAGTLAALRDRIGGEVVVAAADVIAGIDIARLIDTHRSSGAAATVAVVESDGGADFVVEDGRVTAMIDRRVDPDRPGWMYSATGVLGRDALALLTDTRPAGLAESVLALLVQRGDLAAVVHDGYLLDVGTPARYLRANLDVLYGHAPRPPAGVPGDIVEVQGGRAYVGPGARVASSALGPGAVVLGEAELEPGAYVENAVVMPGARVGSDEQIVDTVRS